MGRPLTDVLAHLAARTVLAALLAACNGAAPASPHAAAPEATSGSPAPAPAPGHGEELLPGLARLSPAPLATAEELPTDRDGMLKAGRAALAEGRLDEALSIAEVLLLLHGPADLEARELRGRCLSALGEAEAAREELSACCGAGHRPCCSTAGEAR